MTDHHFNNDADQAERKAIVANDSNFVRQQNELDTSGGRFAKSELQPSSSAPTMLIRPLPQGRGAVLILRRLKSRFGYSVDDMEK